MIAINQMHSRFETIWTHLDEKGRRLGAASEAKAHGRGGLKMVHEVTGMSRTVISEGIREIAGEKPIQKNRIRRSGTGRKTLRSIDETLLDDLKALVESSTMGDPESPLFVDNSNPSFSGRSPPGQGT